MFCVRPDPLPNAPLEDCSSAAGVLGVVAFFHQNRGLGALQFAIRSWTSSGDVSLTSLEFLIRILGLDRLTHQTAPRRQIPAAGSSLQEINIVRNSTFGRQRKESKLRALGCNTCIPDKWIVCGVADAGAILNGDN